VDEVEVAALGPIVVEVDQLQPAAALREVGEDHRVELLRPRRRHRSGGAGGADGAVDLALAAEKDPAARRRSGRSMRGDGGGDIGGCCGLLRAYRLANAYRPVETGVGPVGQEAVCKVGPTGPSPVAKL